MDSMFRFGFGKGKRKQPPDGSQSARSSKRATTGSSILDVGSSQQSIDPTRLNSPPKCFRISGVPSSWNENDVFDALHIIDPSLTHQNFRSSLYPGCSGSTQVALLNSDSGTKHFECYKYLKVPESTNRTVVLTIDSDFFNLTPLNIPEGEIVAELVLAMPSGGYIHNANAMVLVV
jgi:hypothetical protein